METIFCNGCWLNGQRTTRRPRRDGIASHAQRLGYRKGLIYLQEILEDQRLRPDYWKVLQDIQVEKSPTHQAHEGTGQ